MTATALRSTAFLDSQINQRAASDPASSVWVNASAGAGKTTVLTARVTRLLLAGVLPEKILCLTYTRAGAAEMFNRVTATLSKWATCADDALRDDLFDLQKEAPTRQQMDAARRLFAKVLSCPGSLRIRTIHSFCQEVLSRFPIEAGLPPHFGLIDEQESEVLRTEILDDLLDEIGENPAHELASALATLIAAQGETGFAKMIGEIIAARGRIEEAVTGAGDLARLVDKIYAFLEIDPQDTPETLRAEAMQALPEAALRSVAQALAKGGKSDLDSSALLAALLDMPPEARAKKFEAYASLFLTQKHTPRARFASKEVLKKHPEISALVERETVLLQLRIAQIESAAIAAETQSVLRFGVAFAARLAERKAARAVLDYDDLILHTESLLRQPGIAPWILYKLDKGIDHILVDEAQDTSRAQWNIVQALTEEFYAGLGAQGDKTRTLFVVGDEKQSIFSFQNADPDAFLSLRAFFTQRLAEAGKRLEKIGLHTSFRSAPAILRAVDKIFESEEARTGVASDKITHEPCPNKDGSDKAGRVEVWSLLKAAREDTESNGTWLLPTGYEEERDPEAELAQQIALKIKSWLTRKEVLPGFSRPVIPVDIMILLRHRGRFADLMVRALKANKVPVTGVDRMRLVRQLSVMDLLAALRFVLLPEDDLNLAALLRSPLLGMSEEDLMKLAIGRRATLWQSLKDNAALFPDAHLYLTARLGEADLLTPFAFLSHLLTMPCPGNAISGRRALWARLGDEALDPIEELLNKAQAFGGSHSPSLQNFLHWLTEADAEIKRELDHGDAQSGGQVRLMTVHASKGLEAPIVFLPDTVSLPLPQHVPKLQWSKEGLPVFIARKPEFGAAGGLWQMTHKKQREEYRRLFYVALTRASHRLYLCGWLNKKTDEAPAGSWYDLASALRSEHRDFHPVEDGPKPEIIHADSTPLAPPLQDQARESTTPCAPLPVWARRRVEAVFTAPVLTSSDFAEDTSAASPDTAFARGCIIHRLLQSLPDLQLAQRAAAMERFLWQPRHGLTHGQREEIAQEVGRLMKEEAFALLFGAESRAEVPLTGRLDGAPIFRQVDRLCLRGDEVWIVDYKTNRPPPERATDIPASYRRQMNEYHLLLREIYPDKKVRCFLLWTYRPSLMEVEL